MSSAAPVRKGRSAKAKNSSSEEVESSIGTESEYEAADETDEAEIHPSISTTPRYYLLKLTTRSWEVKRFTIGMKGWFHARIGDRAREEYDLFERLNPGDRMIAFSEELQCLYGELQVVEGIRPDVDAEERIVFVIAEIFSHPIAFEKIKQLPFAEGLQSGSRRLFELDNSMANTLLELSRDPSVSVDIPGPAASYIDKEIQISLPNYNTEGNHKETEDKLAFENDIESMAAVMSLKTVKPPLAIGLFGKWGSGKSFFMEKLYEKVDEFSRYQNVDFVQNVVQVRFNSWHYTDSNLWASIVSEIFDSLNRYANNSRDIDDLQKLQETLSITTRQKELAEGRRQQLEANIHHFQTEQDQKRKRLEDITALGLIKKVLSDKTISDDLKKFKAEPVEKIIANINDVETAVDQLSLFLNRFKASWVLVKEARGGRWFFLILFILVLVATGSLLYNGIASTPFIKSAISRAVLISSTVAGLVGYVLRFLAPVITFFDKAIDRLNSVKATLATRDTIANAEVTKQEDELSALTTQIVRLETSIASNRKEVNDILSGSKLYEFIEQGGKNESYSRQLGLVSMIRKDFNRLDELLRMQHDAHNKIKIDNPLDVKLRIDRIVLYIDDLDRCNEDIVLKVLEAIHLLLAFPLFVVVVGVDPRWLNNALNTKYKALFGINNNSKRPQNDKNIASSYDYLEKIFQIPFCLKPITKEGRNDLIAYLLQKEMEEPKSEEREGSAKTPDNQDTTAKTSGQIPIPGERINRIEHSPQNVSIQREDQQKQPMNVRIKALVNQLTFAREELTFMQCISGVYAASPRTIKRFVNIYRIIKTHKSITITAPYSKDDFAPVLILLSIVVGCSEQAEAFVKQLQSAKDETPFELFMNSTDICRQIAVKLMPDLDDEVRQYPVKVFKSNVELISRFSFRTLLS